MNQYYRIGTCVLKLPKISNLLERNYYNCPKSYSPPIHYQTTSNYKRMYKNVYDLTAFEKSFSNLLFKLTDQSKLAKMNG